MPNRIIHEKSLTSETLSRLSAEAERLFWRLTVVADDQGRFDAYPQTVKAECFPRLVDHIKTKDVISWMRELTHECICLYTVEGRQYGYFVKWAEYQRIYGNKPKFPQPPADCGSSPQNPALILTPITTPTPTITTTGHSSVTDEEFMQFWEAYPKKVGKGAALQAWRKAKQKPAASIILQAIESQKKSEQWSKDNGQFIPNPSTWLNQGRWADQLNQAKPTLAQEFFQRHAKQEESHGLSTVLRRVAATHCAAVGPQIPGPTRVVGGTADDDQDPARAVF